MNSQLDKGDNYFVFDKMDNHVEEIMEMNKSLISVSVDCTHVSP